MMSQEGSATLGAVPCPKEITRHRPQQAASHAPHGLANLGGHLTLSTEGQEVAGRISSCGSFIESRLNRQVRCDTLQQTGRSA